MAPIEGRATAPAIFSAGRAVLIGCGLSLVLSPLFTWLELRLIARTWSACDLGINNVANAGALLFLYAPALLVLNTLVLPLALALAAAATDDPPALWQKHLAIPRTLASSIALFIGVVGFAIILWAALASAIPGNDYPTECVDLAPAWWPSVLPV